MVTRGYEHGPARLDIRHDVINMLCRHMEQRQLVRENMIEPGQICRDRTCKKFKIAIVLGPSMKGGKGPRNDYWADPGRSPLETSSEKQSTYPFEGPKLRVCRWQPSPNPSVVDGRWSAPCALFEHRLEPLPADFDLTSRRGQVVAAARRSVVNGLVRWQVSPRFSGDKLTEVHNVGKVRP